MVSREICRCLGFRIRGLGLQAVGVRRGLSQGLWVTMIDVAIFTCYLLHVCFLSICFSFCAVSGCCAVDHKKLQDDCQGSFATYLCHHVSL